MSRAFGCRPKGWGFESPRHRQIGRQNVTGSVAGCNPVALRVLKVRVLPCRPKTMALEKSVIRAFDTTVELAAERYLGYHQRKMLPWCKWINTSDF